MFDLAMGNLLMVSVPAATNPLPAVAILATKQRPSATEKPKPGIVSKRFRAKMFEG